METEKLCKCRCPCHSRADHNLIQLDPDFDQNSDGMSWAQGAIRSDPVEYGPTYPHPTHHFPFGENWTAAAITNPFKMNSTPKAHKALSNSFIHAKDMVKTLAAKWEAMCVLQGGGAESKRNSNKGNKKSVDRNVYSSEQTSDFREEPSSPAKVSVDSDNQPLSNYPLQQKNFLADEDNAYFFHPTNPFQVDKLKKVEESIPPPPTPRVPSDLLDTHSFHCSELHARLNLGSGKNDCSNKQCCSEAGDSGKKRNQEINDFNTINITTNVETSEENGSVLPASYSPSPRSSSPESSSSRGIVLSTVSEPNEKSEAGEEEDGNRKSLDSTEDDLGHHPRYKTEKEITLEWNNSPRQSLPNEVEEEVRKPDDDVDNKVEMELQHMHDEMKKKNCIEKKSVMDVAVQTSVQKYRTEMSITLENPEEIASPVPPKLEKFHKDDASVDDNNSDGESGRESHSTKHGEDDLRPFVTPEIDGHPEGHHYSGREEQQQQTVMSSLGEEQECTYHSWVSIPNNSGDQRESSTAGDMEDVAEPCGCEECGSDERTVIPVVTPRYNQKDGMREATQNDKVLAMLSENYDNVKVTGPIIQVEPIERSVSVTNVNQNSARRRSKGSSDTEKKKIAVWGIRQQYCICMTCMKIIDTNETAFSPPGSSSSVAWHSHCFQCKLCAKPLSEKDHGFYKDQPYCSEHYTSFTKVKLPKCFKCHERILDPSYTSAGGSAWHKDHFTCHSCHQPLTDTKFVFSQTNSPYCLPCHGKSFPKECKGCQKRISSHDPFVNIAKSGTQQVCWHSSQTCLTCSSCGESLVGRPIFFRKDNELIYCNRYCAVH